ncbi:hypothetical protein CJA_1390 [Cellvibrio japonicus Ueda107]|uniref:Uncharacterized protein n=1 Tax=Cellvibrio japonicus (strain Ueda107) TaxID=498211 RepID=B3PD25_CELJU|nr:hypothetical protein CJA_1390 [Cellvibrio japonicus Ueda107]
MNWRNKSSMVLTRGAKKRPFLLDDCDWVISYCYLAR